MPGFLFPNLLFQTYQYLQNGEIRNRAGSSGRLFRGDEPVWEYPGRGEPCAEEHYTAVCVGVGVGEERERGTVTGEIPGIDRTDEQDQECGSDSAADHNPAVGTGYPEGIL
jgi:hypothetical protein